MEVVVPGIDGRAEPQVVIASRTENPDLFWAARGSGTGFFGVVTRFWARTEPAGSRGMWERVMSFDISSPGSFKPIMSWALDQGKAIPKLGTEINIGTWYGEKFAPPGVFSGDDIPPGAKLLISIMALAYADTEREAQTMLSPYKDIPEDIRHMLVMDKPVGRMAAWDEYFMMQDVFCGSQKGERWQINSILSEPSIPMDQVCGPHLFCSLMISWFPSI
jgi:hypothetical protein